MNKDDLQHLDSKSGVQVISRMAAIMRALSANPGGLSLAAIAKEVDLPRSTVQRLVTAMEAEELVDAKGPNGGTRLGPAIGQFLAMAHADAIVFGRYYLKELVNATNETASIVTLVGRQGMVLESFSVEHVVRIVLPLGAQSPLYATAGGKALLAKADDEVIADLCREPFEQFTESTTPALSKLLDEIGIVRQTGFAYAREEHTPGLSSIATEVNTVLGLYALEVALPEARFEQKKAVIEKALVACRRSIIDKAGEFQNIRVGYLKQGKKP